MAVAPLNLPGYAQSRDLDFSSLANLGQVYKQAAADTARRETLAQLGNGDKIDPRVLLSSGDMSLANLGVQIQNRQEDQARQAQQDARQLERDKVADANSAAYLRIAQANLARSNDKTPTGFQSDGQGGYKPIAGGPADPAYLRAKGEAENSVAKPRQLSIGDITKLAEEGGKFANVSGFSDTFKPEYAGRTILGDAANIAGRNLPEAVVGKTIADGASWWQGYDRYKNVVRNELFGSALTAPEKAAFEQADINPRMDPAQIQKNLATQKRIAENGLRRKADAMIQSGYNPDVVSKAYGVDLGPVGQPKSQQQATPALPKMGELRDGYRYKGGNPADPASWVKQQ